MYICVDKVKLCLVCFLSYNASLEMGSNSTTIQIGCSSAVNDNTCSPEGEPSDADAESVACDKLHRCIMFKGSVSC